MSRNGRAWMTKGSNVSRKILPHHLLHDAKEGSKTKFHNRMAPLLPFAAGTVP